MFTFLPSSEFSILTVQTLCFICSVFLEFGSDSRDTTDSEAPEILPTSETLYVGSLGFALGTIFGGLKGLNPLGMLEPGGNLAEVEADFIGGAALTGFITELGPGASDSGFFPPLFFIPENIDLMISSSVHSIGFSLSSTSKSVFFSAG